MAALDHQTRDVVAFDVAHPSVHAAGLRAAIRGQRIGQFGARVVQQPIAAPYPYPYPRVIVELAEHLHADPLDGGGRFANGRVVSRDALQVQQQLGRVRVVLGGGARVLRLLGVLEHEDHADDGDHQGHRREAQHQPPEQRRLVRPDHAAPCSPRRARCGCSRRRSSCAGWRCARPASGLR